MRTLIGVFSLMMLTSLAVRADGGDAVRGWYLGGALGLNWVADQDVVRTTTVGALAPAIIETNLDWDRGASLSAVLGYRLNANLRVEGELARRSNDIDRVRLPTGFTASGGGDIAVTSVIFNALYEFSTGSPLNPYVGAGLGAAYLDFDITDSLSSASDTNSAWAFQAIAGVNWAVSPRWELFAQYQYFWVPDAGIAATTRRTPSSNTYELDDYRSQSVSVGLRYRF
jgi:opacity protein-like surface antigen